MLKAILSNFVLKRVTSSVSTSRRIHVHSTVCAYTKKYGKSKDIARLGRKLSYFANHENFKSKAGVSFLSLWRLLICGTFLISSSAAMDEDEIEGEPMVTIVPS